MVKTAEADIICPTVAAEDPYGLLGEVILLGEDFLSVVTAALLELSYESVCCSAVLLAVIYCRKVSVCGSLNLCAYAVLSCKSCNLLDEVVSESLLTEVHTVAVLCVILEEGVSPCRTLAVLICCVR